MNILREHNIGKVTAILLVVALLLPLSLKFAHIFEGHEHEICTSKDAKHIHNIDHDCEFHKFKQNNVFSFVPHNYTFLVTIEQKQDFRNYYNFLSEYQKLHFKLRGPPQLI